MADIRDPQTFMAGRWKWTAYGYERPLHRGCAFTDIDGATERNGQLLIIEAKEWHRDGRIPNVPTGQRIFLEALSRLQTPHGMQAVTVFVIAGCAHLNDPARVDVLQRGTVRANFEWATPEEGRTGLLDLIATWAAWAEMDTPWYAEKSGIIDRRTA